MDDLTTLAALLVREAFGELPQRVARALMSRGRLPLTQLMAEAGVTLHQTQAALLVLLLHNCLNVETTARGLEYELNVSNVLMRLRFPRFLLHARSLFNDEGEFLVEEILLHGRLNKTEAVTLAAQRITRLRPSIPADKTSLKVQEAFLKLARAGYLVRVDQKGAALALLSPGAEGKGDKDKDDEKGKKRKTPAKKSPKSKEGKEEKEAAKEGGDKKRKTKSKEKAAATSNAPPELLMMTKGKEAPEAPEIRASKKEKESSEPQIDVAAAFTEVSAELTWRVNYTRFIMAFRREACALLVAEKIHPTAGAIVRALNALTETAIETRADEFSGQVSVNALIDQLHKDDHSIAKEQVELYLELLCTDRAGLVRKVVAPQDERFYILNVTNIVNLLRQKVAETAVLDKFGPAGLRIFRLLLAKHQLEQRQVSDMAMLPLKDAREKLYLLLGAEFLSLQEVSKAADHAPYHTFYLFTVRLEHTFRKIEAELIKSMKNLKMREMTELGNADEILKRIEEDRERQDGKLGPEEQKTLDAIGKIEDRVAHALLNLDYTRMVLTDW